MNQLDVARNKLLIALFVDSHRPERRHLSREQLQTEYFLKLDTRLFNSLAKELRDGGLIKTYPDRATYLVRLRSDAHAAALSRILAAIDAESFSVNWQGQRIGTDAESELSKELLMAIPDGWLLMTYAKAKPTMAAASTPALAQQISAARDVIVIGGNVHDSTIAGSERDNSTGWTKWGTIFGGLGLLVAIAAIISEFYL